VEYFVAVAVLIALLLFVLRGSPELARFEVKAGKFEFVRGRVPPKLLDDFADVLSNRPLADATVRVVLDGGRPRVVATGLPEDELQRLRNVAGPYTAAQFRAGRTARR
jgi:hypothetical protein